MGDGVLTVLLQDAVSSDCHASPCVATSNARHAPNATYNTRRILCRARARVLRWCGGMPACMSASMSLNALPSSPTHKKVMWRVSFIYRLESLSCNGFKSSHRHMHPTAYIYTHIQID